MDAPLDQPCDIEPRLVICAAAPGSMWSRIVKRLAGCPSVDDSDARPHRMYTKTSHFGNYFGPGMEHGQDFAEIAARSPNRSSLLAELAKPFAEPFSGKWRLLKGHAFAYALPFWRRMLPRSRFLLIWRDDADCLAWWLEAGGFEITYPSYAWYRDVPTMERAIRAENAAIRAFAAAEGVELRPRPLEEVARSLGLLREGEAAPASWEGGPTPASIGVA